MPKLLHRPEARRAFASRPFKEQLQELFSLHRAERRGTAALIVLMLCSGGAYWYHRYRYRPPTDDLEPLRAELEAWLAQRDGADRREEQAATPAAPFPFDPNSIDAEAWQRLGLSARQADAIGRYLSKGGRFRSKADLARFRAIGPDQLERLRPFILLPDSLPRATAPAARPATFAGTPQYQAPPPASNAAASPSARPAAAVRKAEVNTADSAALVALPGIGPAFARGIIRYRDRLGGFRSLNQLAEVRVLKDKPDAVQRLKELLEVDTLAVRRIAINTCTAEDLAAHPYARWDIAKPVIAYRQHHGPFRSLEELRAIPAFDEERFRKLAPYLSLE
ncbi:MAG: ComEA family DNA-binding protein [Flavobacteriales bacterium]